MEIDQVSQLNPVVRELNKISGTSFLDRDPHYLHVPNKCIPCKLDFQSAFLSSQHDYDIKRLRKYLPKIFNYMALAGTPYLCATMHSSFYVNDFPLAKDTPPNRQYFDAVKLLRWCIHSLHNGWCIHGDWLLKLECGSE